MPAADAAAFGLFAARAAVFVGEPLGVALAVAVVAIAVVEEMAEFVDQDVVQVEVLDRLLGPDELPHAGRFVGPPAAVGTGFVG